MKIKSPNNIQKKIKKKRNLGTQNWTQIRNPVKTARNSGSYPNFNKYITKNKNGKKTSSCEIARAFFLSKIVYAGCV